MSVQGGFDTEHARERAEKALSYSEPGNNMAALARDVLELGRRAEQAEQDLKRALTAAETGVAALTICTTGWQLSEERVAGLRAQLEGGAGLIATERQRQIDVEGWTPDHDDGQARDEIARAAAQYAIPTYLRGVSLWPWGSEWWKPTPSDRVKELVKAGALIAAEIDRLQRLAGRGVRGPGHETR